MAKSKIYKAKFSKVSYSSYSIILMLGYAIETN